MTKTKIRPEDPHAELEAADLEVAAIDAEVAELRDRIAKIAADREERSREHRLRVRNRPKHLPDSTGRAKPWPPEWEAEDDAAQAHQTHAQAEIGSINRQIAGLRRRRQEITDSSRQLRRRLVDLSAAVPIEPLADDVEKARAALDVLLTELAAIPDLVAEAEANCDAVTAVQLALRSRVLPVEIQAAQRLLTNVQKRHAEAMIASFADALLDAGAVVQEAEAKVAAATSERDQCQTALRVLLAEQARWRDRVRQLTAELK